ncbi:MAG: biotin--[acetyl-CoA-carboxylase] ligase [Bacteroidales bacterium]|nr:biotin--[acetyl-CoA-carboxylase] ligase [Bacteroidales bacterium]
MFLENPFFIDITDSTNKKLKELLTENAELPDYFCVAADYQSAGRGQGSNRWQSDRGQNVLASLLFKPSYPPAQQFVLNQCFALSVRKLLSKYVNGVKIKWPNDIYVDYEKIAGILIEHSIEGEHIKNTIAGVGININQTDFDKGIPNPTSLKLLTNRDFDVREIVLDLVEVCRQYQCSDHTDYQKIHQEYLENLLLYQEFAWYETVDKKIEAKITGTDEYGRLLLKDRNGNNYCCGMKEIRLCLK